VFNHPIEKVWNLIKDARQINKISPLHKELVFIKGTNSYEVGTIFSFRIAGIIHCTLSVESIVDEEDSKVITFKCVKSQPANMRYTMSWMLFRDTIDGNTLLIWEIKYDDDCIPVPEDIETGIQIRNNLVKKFDEYLKLNYEDVSQTETIVLNIKRTCLWAIISNWTNFKKIVPFIADEVIYEGDPSTVDTKLTLKWIKKKVECHLKVVKVNCDKKKETWEYHMNCYKGVPAVPNQDIKFKIIRINDSTCFLEFKHAFKQHIKQDILDTIAKDKKKILLSLKDNLQ